ncbi:Sterol 3-beta-glucosyltransferase-like protein 5 [Elsinoe fawcettii]|nr:Sterol 3-beta-glucosyltransferase-like protein 5 [Elsinoe fawcettii]
MTPRIQSEGINDAQDTVPEYEMMQQAREAAAQPDHTEPVIQDTPLDSTDLLIPDTAANEVPPPAYGDIYGEIRSEQNGLGTSARITDDGRVNIRINQFNRHLSQLLTPALNHHIRDVKQSEPPPPPFVAAPGESIDQTPPPPPLNVVIQVVGSRGDVQPFVALGKVLKGYGHRVRLATHPNFKAFVEENGLEFFNIGGDPSTLMAFMVKNPSLMPGFRSVISGDIKQRRRDVSEYIQGCWRSCYQAGDGMDPNAAKDDSKKPTTKPFVADCIIANPPSFAHIHCAERLGVPLHIMFTMPYSPTQAFPHPLANIQSSDADQQLTNYLSYSMVEFLSWQGLGDIINRFRAKCLGLDPVSLTWAPGMLQRLKVPHTYCWSPALIPKPNDWGHHIDISGFFFLDAPNYTPPSDLQAFLDAGSPPVYIGFGSIVLADPDAMTQLIFDAVKKTGRRALVAKGWGGMGSDRLDVPNGVFMLGKDVPHDWLFKKVSCVVHHGGAGTTAAGIAAGRPTVVVPFFGDQPFWGAMVAKAGAGPDPIPHKQLTVDRLADAINFCLTPESLSAAKDLASKVAEEKGTNVGARSFHQYLQPDRLRCTLAPSRVAAWRIKRTKIRLSPFAACTLANANLLSFRDLKLYRPQEYETDEGPWDPISGGFIAACEAFGGMARGLADIPTETYKAATYSFKTDKQKSKGKGPAQSQTSLDSQDHLPSLDGSKDDGSSRRSISSQSDARSTKDQDMLRHKGAHRSKGVGRFTRTLIESPVEVSMSLTKGSHNLPKLWGDDTVRAQPQVDGFVSGARAAGKHFGLGMYDGLTGIVTQPWKGAQKEGAVGFAKGVGRGFGGFFAKSMAGSLGILSYPLKGVQKEVQKLFNGNVQNYIITSRTVQGYEDWSQSSEMEKQEVIDQWHLIQKFLKGKNKDEMMRDTLEAHRRTDTTERSSMMDTASSQTADRVSTSTRSSSVNSLGTEVGELTPNGSRSPRESFWETRARDTKEPSERATATDAVGAGSSAAGQHTSSQPDPSYPVGTEDQDDDKNIRQAMINSEEEARCKANEDAEDERRLKQAIAQSQQEQLFKRSPGDMWRNLVAGEEAGPSSQHSPPYDPGHLAGTTQSQFEAHRQGQAGEKTTQERREEDIVMEYMKKQSLLEGQHKKGKGRASTTDDEDEDLRKAMELSMRGH